MSTWTHTPPQRHGCGVLTIELPTLCKQRVRSQGYGPIIHCVPCHPTRNQILVLASMRSWWEEPHAPVCVARKALAHHLPQAGQCPLKQGMLGAHPGQIEAWVG